VLRFLGCATKLQDAPEKINIVTLDTCFDILMRQNYLHP
jgi:hypothetical protein